MKQQWSWLERWMDTADLPGESVPGQSVVELLGDRRVLIEHHGGVTKYGREEIRVRVTCGELWVCGSGLEMMKMTHSQLVITGCVEGITLKRRQEP